MAPFRRLILLLLALGLEGCSHAPPQVVQIFNQVNRVYDPGTGAWSARLSVFLQVSSADGTKVFDRLHVIHDGQQLVFTLGSGQWTVVDRPGEYWVGANGLSLGGTVPTGAWRTILVTKSGQRVETAFQVPAVPPDAPAARTAPVTVTAVSGAPGRFQVSGWVDDTLVWFRDAKAVVSRAKFVGNEWVVPGGVTSSVLYSYDKNRGEGLEAGPFPVQDPGKPADR